MFKLDDWIQDAPAYADRDHNEGPGFGAILIAVVALFLFFVGSALLTVYVL